MIKPIEECHRIIQYEQKRRETIDRAFEAVKEDMPSEAQTRYNQRDIQKRNQKGKNESKFKSRSSELHRGKLSRLC